MSGFIKYMRSEEAEYLLSYPNANHLFMVMAYRARRTDHPINGLKAGQCFLGDYSAIGLTERQYRTAKKQLTDWGLATFKGTNKGTVGTVLNTKVYDINEEASDGQKDMQATDKGRANDGQATTNKECKKEIKKECNKKASLDWSAAQMSESEIKEVLQIRKNAKAPVTQIVINKLAKEFALSRQRGMSNDDILNIWSSKGWRSYENSWVKEDQVPRAPIQEQIQKTQADIEAARQKERDEIWENMQFGRICNE